MTDAQELADELQLILDLDDLAKRAYAVAGKGEARLREASRVFGVNSGAWRGELLALVREAWGPDVNIMERTGTLPGFGVIVIWRGAEVLFVHDNDGRPERLVAALEAAP